ncbi:MAG: putative rane protein [Clostridia bacterium]|nr:putative rane protein [Clostridia bacterium]
MELTWIWQSILIFYVGTLILRVGGRKSISQMTIAQTIVMIGLGSLLIQPVAGKGLLITFLAAFILTLLMIITEYMEIKADFLETLFTGKAVIVIEDGKPNIKNLKKIRMTIDRLETRLRQAGISAIEDVKYATIEVSGQLGYELKDNKKPLTKGDFIELMAEIAQVKQVIERTTKTQGNQNQKSNIFQEINTKEFEGNNHEP